VVAAATTTTTTTINYNCAAGDVVSHKHTHTYANGDGGGEYVGLRSSGRSPARRTTIATDAVVAYSHRCCSRRRLPWWGSAVGAVFGRNRRRLLCLGTFHPRRATATAQATSRQRQHERERRPCMTTLTSYERFLTFHFVFFCLLIKSRINSLWCDTILGHVDDKIQSWRRNHRRRRRSRCCCLRPSAAQW